MRELIRSLFKEIEDSFTEFKKVIKILFFVGLGLCLASMPLLFFDVIPLDLFWIMFFAPLLLPGVFFIFELLFTFPFV